MTRLAEINTPFSAMTPSRQLAFVVAVREDRLQRKVRPREQKVAARRQAAGYEKTRATVLALTGHPRTEAQRYLERFTHDGPLPAGIPGDAP